MRPRRGREKECECEREIINSPYTPGFPSFSILCVEYTIFYFKFLLQLSPHSKKPSIIFTWTWCDFHWNIQTQKYSFSLTILLSFTWMLSSGTSRGQSSSTDGGDDDNNKVSNNVNKMFTWIFDNCKWSIRMPIIIDAKCDQSTGLLFLFRSFSFDSFFKRKTPSHLLSTETHFSISMIHDITQF